MSLPKKQPHAKLASQKTSWGPVADWYHEHLSEDDTYHSKVVLPNVLRVLGRGEGRALLDIACGDGFLTREFQKAGFMTTGADISQELIALAKKAGPPDIRYDVAPAEGMPYPDQSFDVATCILALQNMKDLGAAIGEAARILKKDGAFVMVINHPAFRIPRRSSWGWDGEQGIQFRRIDGYLSDTKIDMQAHPGSAPEITTPSYHHPLQSYTKTLGKHGFLITAMEEWISHRVSEKGPRAEAEDRARKEFPLFLMLSARKQ